MASEHHIRTQVDAAVHEFSDRLDKEVRALVDSVVTAAVEEHEAALAAARHDAFVEAAADTQRQIAEAEARVHATMEEAVSAAREDERAQFANEIRQLVEAETAQALAEASAAADTRLQSALADAEAHAARLLHERVNEARAREREAEMAALTRLLESIRGLDGATSLSEVLDALAQAAAREPSRAAVLVLRSDRLLGWKLTGFGARDTQPKGVDLGLTESGVIGMAVTAARPMSTRDSHVAADGPGFAQLPADRLGFAVPVIVGGRVVAVVYADSVASDGREHSVPSGWPEVIEVLTRHAARCLEALSAQKAASAPARTAVSSTGRPASGMPAAKNKSASDPSALPPEPDAPPGVSA